MLPNTQSCNSMASCDGVHMLYQIPDPSETSIWTNTIWLEMWDAPWLTGPIDIDTSVSDTHTDCTVMWKMDGSGGNNHKIATADCADTNQYVCAFNCQQSELVGWKRGSSSSYYYFSCCCRCRCRCCYGCNTVVVGCFLHGKMGGKPTVFLVAFLIYQTPLTGTASATPRPTTPAPFWWTRA